MPQISPNPRVIGVAKALNTLKEGFICRICLDLLKNPSRTKCGHTFCTLCLQTLIEKTRSKRARCPLCKNGDVTKRSLESDDKLRPLLEVFHKLRQALHDDTQSAIDFEEVRTVDDGSREAGGDTPSKRKKSPDTSSEKSKSPEASEDASNSEESSEVSFLKRNDEPIIPTVVKTYARRSKGAKELVEDSSSLPSEAAALDERLPGELLAGEKLAKKPRHALTDEFESQDGPAKVSEWLEHEASGTATPATQGSAGTTKSEPVTKEKKKGVGLTPMSDPAPKRFFKSRLSKSPASEKESPVGQNPSITKEEGPRANSSEKMNVDNLIQEINDEGNTSEPEVNASSKSLKDLVKEMNASPVRANSGQKNVTWKKESPVREKSPPREESSPRKESPAKAGSSVSTLPSLIPNSPVKTPKRKTPNRSKGRKTFSLDAETQDLNDLVNNKSTPTQNLLLSPVKPFGTPKKNAIFVDKRSSPRLKGKNPPLPKQEETRKNPPLPKQEEPEVRRSPRKHPKVTFQLKGTVREKKCKLTSPYQENPGKVKFIQLGRLAANLQPEPKYPTLSEIVSKGRNSLERSGLLAPEERSSNERRSAVFKTTTESFTSTDRHACVADPGVDEGVQTTQNWPTTSDSPGSQERTQRRSQREVAAQSTPKPIVFKEEIHIVDAPKHASPLYKPDNSLYFDPMPSCSTGAARQKTRARTKKLKDEIEIEESSVQTRRSKRRLSKEQLVQAVKNEGTVKNEEVESAKKSSQSQASAAKKSKLAGINIKSRLTPSEKMDIESTEIKNSASIEDLEEGGGEPPKPLSSGEKDASFMRKIIGFDKDLYSSDEETQSQQERRVKKIQMEEELEDVYAFDKKFGKFEKKKRRRIKKPASSSDDDKSQEQEVTVNRLSRRRSHLPEEEVNRSLKKESSVSYPKADDFEPAKDEGEDEVIDIPSQSTQSSVDLSTQEGLKRAWENIEKDIPDRLKAPADVETEPMTDVDDKPKKALEMEEKECDLPDIEEEDNPTEHQDSERQTNASTGTDGSADLDPRSTQEIQKELQELEDRVRREEGQKKEEERKKEEEMKEDSENTMAMENPEKSVIVSQRRTETTPNRRQSQRNKKSSSQVDSAEEKKTKKNSQVESVEESDDDLFESTPGSVPNARGPLQSRDNGNKRSLDNGKSSSQKRPRIEKEVDTEEEDPPSQLVSAQPVHRTLEELARTFRVVATGIHSRDRRLFDAFTLKFDCTVAQTVDATVTHVVVNHDENMWADRTLKFLQAVALGRLVVGIRWIREYFRTERLAAPEEFEVLDNSGADGPRRARIAIAQTKLLKNFEVHLAGEFSSTIPTARVEELLAWSGATIVRNVNMMSFGRGITSLIIVDRSKHIDQDEWRRMFQMSDVAVVDKDWLIESIGTYRLQPIVPYLQHEASVALLQDIGYRSDLLFAATPESNSMSMGFL